MEVSLSVPFLMLLCVVVEGGQIDPGSDIWQCDDIDCPEMRVTQSDHAEFEMRVYPESKWVCTSRQAGSSSMFWSLFNYISGDNNKGTKIDMTAPVITKVRAGQCQNRRRDCPNEETMCFYLSKQHWDDTPQPESAAVTVETLPEMTVYVRAFDDWTMSSRRFSRQADVLGQVLNEEDLPHADYYYRAGYDSPWWPWFGRRNEIWVPVPSPSQ